MSAEIQILLAEDNPGDVRLFRRALRNLSLTFDLHVVQDGEAALSFLNRTGPHGDAPRIHLLLLDWNLPKIHGREVLTAIKSNFELKHIPVVILTTSEAEADVLQAYRRYANCYITKPTELQDYQNAIEEIERFWLTCARLPTATV
jgi:chemotaxis family two-component system response regulator Rcp1